jgi:hypothetical protein
MSPKPPDYTDPSFEGPPVRGTPSAAAKPARPAQDEWGLFDPVQCGIPAVLRRLEQMAKKEKSE